MFIGGYLPVSPCLLVTFSLYNSSVFSASSVSSCCRNDFSELRSLSLKKNKINFLAFYIQDLVHTLPKEFENGGVTLEMRQIFSVCTYGPEKFENAPILVHYAFVIEQNLITGI